MMPRRGRNRDHPSDTATVEDMHEVALSSQLAKRVQAAAGDRKVLDVRVEIGALRQVVPETLKYAWGFVVKQTPLENATLSVDWKPLILLCEQGHRSEIRDELGFDCPQCGGATTIVSGNQFSLIDIEVES